MTQNTVGWLLVLGGLGAVLGVVGTEVAALPNWGAALTPSFIGTAGVKVAAVIAAYVGGKLMPQAGAK